MEGTRSARGVGCWAIEMNVRQNRGEERKNQGSGDLLSLGPANHAPFGGCVYLFPSCPKVPCNWISGARKLGLDGLARARTVAVLKRGLQQPRLG